MEVSCSSVDNETIQNDSVQMLSLGLIGFAATLAIGIVGIVNNILLLYIFYRLRWFSKQHLILFWNLAIVDLLVCLTTVVIYSTSITKIFYHTSDIQTQLSCVEKYVTFYLVCAVSGRFAFAIAIDRLAEKLFPYSWYKYEKRFKWGAVVVIWSWSTFSRGVLLMITPEDQCVLACLGCLSYPRNWWYTALTVINTASSCLLIIIYVLLPALAALKLKSCFNNVQSDGLILNYDKLLQRRKAFLARLRLMSGIYIACFLCSFTPATTLCDVIIPMYTFPVNTQMTIAFLAVSDVCFVLNSVLPLYIWIMFDVSFRREFCSLIAKVCFCRNLYGHDIRHDSCSSGTSVKQINLSSFADVSKY